MWVARDKNGDLWLFIVKPNRENEGGYWFVKAVYKGIQIDSSLFPDLKWEDEPIEVFLLSKDSIEQIKKESYASGFVDGNKTATGYY